MTELTFLLLRLGFLLLLWVFIFGIVYALRSDLFGAPARRLRDKNQDNPQPFVSSGQPQHPAMQAATPLGNAAAVSVEPALPTANPLPSADGAAAARVLLITSGVANGTELVLDEDVLTIGRSPDSTLVIVDEYTSTHHAKLTRTGSSWQLTDLDSTNGTKLNGQPVTGSVELPIFTPVTIGTTTFELRP